MDEYRRREIPEPPRSERPCGRYRLCHPLGYKLFFDNEGDTNRSLAELKEEFNKFTEQDAYLIFVTNEIGLGGVSPDAVQRRFTDLQGWFNQYIASRADEVVLMVSGIPMKVK